MNEKELINIIKSTLNSKYIGDDCAYLEDLGIVITQDSLVEDVHFKMDFITPYQLGYKSVMVNISDVCASGAEPKYLTISLSLPNSVDENFVKEFYEGAKNASDNVHIVGGDITGSDKIYISVTAIGSTRGRKISSKQISENITCDYAMMDTSDGLADALIQIAKASDVILSINTSKIPHDKSVDMDTVLYGGEDYQLVATVPDHILKNLNDYTIIGEVKEKISDSGLLIDQRFYTNIDEKLYNHFKE